MQKKLILIQKVIEKSHQISRKSIPTETEKPRKKHGRNPIASSTNEKLWTTGLKTICPTDAQTGSRYYGSNYVCMAQATGPYVACTPKPDETRQAYLHLMEPKVPAVEAKI